MDNNYVISLCYLLLKIVHICANNANWHDKWRVTPRVYNNALTFSLSVPSSFTSTLFFSWPGPGAVGKLE